MYEKQDIGVGEGDVEAVGDEDDEYVDVGDGEDGPAEEGVEEEGVAVVSVVDEEEGEVEQSCPREGVADLVDIGGDGTSELLRHLLINIQKNF